MKKPILFLILLSVYCNAKSQIYISLEDGTISYSKEDITPTRTIDQIDNGVIVTYEFKNAFLQKDNLYTESYWWKLNAFGFTEFPTEPAIPTRIDKVEIPYGKKAIVNCIGAEYIDLDYPLCPARNPLIESKNEEYTLDNVPQINEIDEWLPNQLISDKGTDTYRGVNIVNISISPIQYNSMKKVTRAYKKIIYKVSFISDNNIPLDTSYFPIIADTDEFLSASTLNHYINNSYNIRSESIDNTQSYLVISTPKFASAIQNFCEWKSLLGFNVLAKINEKWTVEDLKKEIRADYNSLKNLYYVIIVGDFEDVPASTSNLQYKHVTDFYYGCINDYDKIQSLYVGRIPVSNIQEANNVINKIIEFEKHPNTNPSFYQNALHCAYFQDVNCDGYADRRFAQTSEDIRNYVMTQGKTIQRVYKTPSYIIPQKWNNGIYSTGENIPEELLKPNFKWNGDSTEISAAINNGVFYVLHRDHGDTNRWGDPAYDLNNIHNLKNGDKLPIIFSINCLTGKFDEGRCFSEEFIRKENGGCVAIYGASEVSYSGHNDVLAGGMFDAIWPNPGLTINIPSRINNTNYSRKPIYRLGQILQYGLSRMSEVYVDDTKSKYSREIFHCFGDPSMLFPTECPSPYNNIQCIHDKTQIMVKTNDPTSVITFYDKKQNITTSRIASSAIYKSDSPENIIVCISGHNKIPYIVNGNDCLLIQNETIVEDINYTANKVIIGSNVSDSKEAGPVVFKNGKITIEASTIEILPQTTISKDVELELKFK